jgi:hypothetical protein
MISPLTFMGLGCGLYLAIAFGLLVILLVTGPDEGDPGGAGEAAGGVAGLLTPIALVFVLLVRAFVRRRNKRGTNSPPDDFHRRT